MKGGNYGWPICLGICHNPSFIDPIVDFTPVVTPTGIATVAPNVYYFVEWNTGNLMRLELTPTGSVVSMNQVYTQNGGIVGVETNPNGMLYFTNPDGIYTYQIQAATPTPTPVDPTLILLGSVAAIAVAVILAYTLVRHRNNHSPQASPVEIPS